MKNQKLMVNQIFSDQGLRSFQSNFFERVLKPMRFNSGPKIAGNASFSEHAMTRQDYGKF